jgi:hypothetical protein
MEPKAEQSWKIKFGWKSLQGSGIVKFLLCLPRALAREPARRDKKNQRFLAELKSLFWASN